jgi:hypothetical protein
LIYRPNVAYFDTNVFQQIVNRDHQGAGLQRKLQDYRRRGELVLPASLVVAEELFHGIGSGGQAKSSRSIEQFQVQWQLCDWTTIANDMETLVVNELRSFARGEASPSPFLESAVRQQLLDGMAAATDGMDRKSPHQLQVELAVFVRKIRHQNVSFSDGMNQGRGQAEELRQELGVKIPTFQQAFDHRALRLVEYLARRAGLLDECKAVGISGLLERPLLKTAIGANLALWYTREFPKGALTPQFELSDSRDMHHATAATAVGARFFVCQEKRLRRMLGLVRECGLASFDIVDLDSLLRELP